MLEHVVPFCPGHMLYYCQGSYRNLTVVFRDFPGQNYFIF